MSALNPVLSQEEYNQLGDGDIVKALNRDDQTEFFRMSGEVSGQRDWQGVQKGQDFSGHSAFVPREAITELVSKQ